MAEKLNFKLFLSFDYANSHMGYDSWPKEQIVELLHQYTGHGAYYHHTRKPFVTTSEGGEHAKDWKSIKKETGCFFVPSWSSLGPKQAARVGAGIVDGLASSTAWPTGPNHMDTYMDAAYIEALSRASKASKVPKTHDSNYTGQSQAYMMPVSPWFYTNLPAYHRNWLWRGEDLWYDRWQQVFYVRPGFVMIYSWNGFEDSTYIGPLREHGYAELEAGQAPFNYAHKKPHDGWRSLLPYLIKTYKYGYSIIEREGVVVWSRTEPALMCINGNTTGNTAQYLQNEFSAFPTLMDEIFFTALLGSRKNVSVDIGDVHLTPHWKFVPAGGVGLYHGSVPYTGLTGTVSVTVWDTNHKAVVRVNGQSITADCSGKNGGMANWNPWVGADSAAISQITGPKFDLTKLACVNGTGKDDFRRLCELSCSYDFCPLDSCICRELGPKVKAPPSTGKKGYQALTLDDRFLRLCNWSCDKGYCPGNVCSAHETVNVSRSDTWYLAQTCTSGKVKDSLKHTAGLDDLCQFSCKYGFCPMHACECEAIGDLIKAPASTPVQMDESIKDPYVYELCKFACAHGHCPSLCTLSSSSSSSPSSSSTPRTPTGQTVHLDPSIWKHTAPAMTCHAPCTLIPAPLHLSTPTTIKFPPWTTTVHYSSLTTTTTAYGNGKTASFPVYTVMNISTVLQIKPGMYISACIMYMQLTCSVTTTAIDVWAITLTKDLKDEDIHMTSSIQPEPFPIILSTFVSYPSSSRRLVLIMQNRSPWPIFASQDDYHHASSVSHHEGKDPRS